ncbi:MAG TPA: hypothetical protein VIT42_00705 [Microlunatus sp.]
MTVVPVQGKTFAQDHLLHTDVWVQVSNGRYGRGKEMISTAANPCAAGSGASPVADPVDVVLHGCPKPGGDPGVEYEQAAAHAMQQRFATSGC